MNAHTKTATWKGLALGSSLLLSGFFLAACGGSGDGGGGISSTPGLSRGEIEGFGSVIVNGVRFHTGGANELVEVQIEGDDNPSFSDLQRGMVVEVGGSFDDNGGGTADTVRYNDNVEGPATLVSQTSMTRTLSVLGQTVIVAKDSTRFDDKNPETLDDTIIDFTALDAALASGVTLEVSGLPQADGSIMATYIQEKTAGGILEVKGIISNLTTSTFSINNLTVDFSSVGAESTEDVAQLANGIIVEVKGTTLVGTTLTATVVEVGIDDLNDDIAKVELQGFITARTDDTFSLNGQAVDMSTTQIFLGGLKEDLVPGVRVEVEGRMSGGTLIAQKIKFKESVRIEGLTDVNDLNPVNAEFSIQGLTGLTIVFDETLTEGTQPGADGQKVKVRGRQLADGKILATRIDSNSGGNDTRVIVQGSVTALARPSLTLLNLITVDTSTITGSADDSPGSTGFEIEDTPVTSDVFFGALNVGDIVKARADLSPFAWDEVEIEMEDDINHD